MVAAMYFDLQVDVSNGVGHVRLQRIARLPNSVSREDREYQQSLEVCGAVSVLLDELYGEREDVERLAAEFEKALMKHTALKEQLRNVIFREGKVSVLSA